MIIHSCSYMHRAKQRPPAVTSGWAVAKAVLWRTSYIFQDPQTKMTGDCDMSTASSKKKTSCGWQMLKQSVKIFACKHHANDTSRPLGIHVLLKLSRGTLAMPVELLPRLRWLMRSLMLCWLMISLWILVC